MYPVSNLRFEKLAAGRVFEKTESFKMTQKGSDMHWEQYCGFWSNIGPRHDSLGRPSGEKYTKQGAFVIIWLGLI
jgi:hypothetical protein